MHSTSSARYQRSSLPLLLTVACGVAGAACSAASEDGGAVEPPVEMTASNEPAAANVGDGANGGSSGTDATAGTGGDGGGPAETNEGTPTVVGGELDGAGGGGAMAGGSGAMAGSAGAMAGGAGSAAMPDEVDPCADDPDGDQDLDGVVDCEDGCPMDFLKIEPGVCGCGASDTDLDLDGTLDCEEECEFDPDKTEAGVCGCGEPDDDGDGDGALDCQDECPFDAARTEAGACGCGAPDNLALCLQHRYSFNGAGTVAIDSVGGADGAIVNTALTAAGSLNLAGVQTDQYVELPSGIMSRLGPSATIEVWLTWTGGAPWQRIFDFGVSEEGPGLQGVGATYLFVTPLDGLDTLLRAAYTNLGPPQERVTSGPAPVLAGVATHVALVINGPAATETLYQDGLRLSTGQTLDTTLADLRDANNWIGRSQFLADEEFQGNVDEFRIYSAVRNDAQIAASVAAGPNALPAQ